MNENKTEQPVHVGPIASTRSGNMEIVVWRKTKYIPLESDDQRPLGNRVITIEYACINLRKWNHATHQWRRSAIWCTLSDLQHLSRAIDQLGITNLENDADVLRPNLREGEEPARR